MEDLSISAKDRLMTRIRERETFITIPERGAQVLYFTHVLNNKTGIEVTTEINDITRKKYKLNQLRPRKRLVKLRIDRKDIGRLEGVTSGYIIRDVQEGYVPTLADTLEFVNLYLGINLDVTDVVTQYFNPKGTILLIRIKRTSLLYFGELRVHLV